MAKTKKGQGNAEICAKVMVNRVCSTVYDLAGPEILLHTSHVCYTATPAYEPRALLHTSHVRYHEVIEPVIFIFFFSSVIQNSQSILHFYIRWFLLKRRINDPVIIYEVRVDQEYTVVQQHFKSFH